MSAQKITINGFLNEFQRRHDQVKDRPFCWVLGSGASVQSGIPSGRSLANQWLKEMHELEAFENLPIESWATENRLGIKGFEYKRAENFYPWIYQRRFRDYDNLGYAFLENTMDHAEPSFGYSVLAQIMATTPHKVAITTNFDNLVADALSIYTRTFPLVCGHESLTGYIRPNLRRPLIAKIHRDLLLAPLSSPDEIANLPGEWVAALAKIFGSYTPIVIGYGGNDGSLMGFLKTVAPIEGGVFWCFHEGSSLDPKIHEVVDYHHGRIVPISGFDELMLQLQETLKLDSLIPQLQGIHEKRVKDYGRQVQVLTAALRKPAGTPAAEEARRPAREAADLAVERLTREKDWLSWQLRADAETDPVKQEAIYREGLEDFPQSDELTGNFALFLHEVRKDYDEAEKFYKKALELTPLDATYTGNFANFLTDIRGRHDEAERLYRRALELDPNNPLNTRNFAIFMQVIRKNYDETERLYGKALEIAPSDVEIIGSFAQFSSSARQAYDKAEQLYRKALELDPNEARNTGNFAVFVENIRKDYDEAERLYRKSLELDPKDATNTGNFGAFMQTKRKNYEEAERLYRRALELDPDNARNIGNLALFEQYIRKNYDEAEILYRKAIELDPNNASNIGNFALFMEGVRKDYDKAEQLYNKASELNPTDESIAEKYKEFLKAHRS